MEPMTIEDYNKRINELVAEIFSHIKSKEKNQAKRKLYLLLLALDSIKDIIHNEI